MERQVLIGEAHECQSCKVVLTNGYYKKAVKRSYWCPKCGVGKMAEFKRVWIEVPLNKEGEKLIMSATKRPDGEEARPEKKQPGVRTTLGIAVMRERSSQEYTVARLGRRQIVALLRLGTGLDVPGTADVRFEGAEIVGDDVVEISWQSGASSTETEEEL